MGTETTPTRPQLKELLLDRRAAAVSAQGQDPRAAPSRVRGNISIAETCEFYGFADAISRCRVPRSCQDCLLTPGCGITGAGLCRNTTSDAYYFQGYEDYTKASFPNNSLVSNTSYSVFLAGTATYCKASDPVCTECRKTFQQIASNTSSSVSNYVMTQFCKGDGGCVCIGICEVPEQRAGRVVDPECAQYELKSNPIPTIVRSRQTIAHGDPRSPVVKVGLVSKKAETCAYTTEQDLRGCRRPRTCQECLLKPGCTVYDGECMSIDSYAGTAKLQASTLNVSGTMWAYGVQFPSISTTYCPLNDAVCASCRREFPNRHGQDWPSVTLNSKYCIGDGGCVCIETCESDVRSKGVYDKECNQFEQRDASTHPGIFLVVIFGALAFLLSIKCCKDARDRSQRSGQTRAQRLAQPPLWRNMLDEVPALTRLDLFGWRAHREELFMREQELLQGLDVAPVRPPAAFDDMSPSAPDFDDDDASAPTAQDPKALASAPFYRTSFYDDESNSSSSSRQETNYSSPSAPDFEMDDSEWESNLITGHDERVGLVTRRPRRNEADS